MCLIDNNFYQVIFYKDKQLCCVSHHNNWCVGHFHMYVLFNNRFDEDNEEKYIERSRWKVGKVCHWEVWF